jgi:hypothetical protein
MDKLPVDHRTLQVFIKDQGWQQDPTAWTSSDNAIALCAMCGPEYGVGFFFTPSDPFFFVDLDGCLNPDGATWSTVAMDIMARLPGAAVEVSQSGSGLHIFGVGALPDHACKNIPLGLELYTEGRFVALTGTNAIGSAATDCNASVHALVNDYFPVRGNGSTEIEDWTTEPVSGYTGPEDDDELISRACASTSAASIFQGRGGFAALWDGDISGHGDDASSADMALAQHLAFWTGKDCERMLRIMKRSGLVRDKWEREKYLADTILKAVSMQVDVYSTAPADTAAADSVGACKLRGSDAQVKYADNVRALKLAECKANEALSLQLAKVQSAKFWIDNKDKTPEELGAMITPVESAADPLGCPVAGPQVVAGFQYLGATQQVEHFKGCMYVQDVHRVLTPRGTMLKTEQFNATYGGYSFQLDDSGDKTTRKAWEAFTESQILRYPKAESTCFRPEHGFGEVLGEDGFSLVNTYLPINTPAIAGDPSKFTGLISKLLPDERDRRILLTYIAALVQNPGRKFQWWPVLQGTEGNGKTAIVSAITYAVGSRYTHCPNVDEISKSGNKFNGWIRGRLFVGMEEVYVANRRDFLEAFKTTVTNDRLPIESKGVDQIMGDNRANGIMCTNHKEGVPITIDGRRYCVFFTAQQSKADRVRDGMGGRYFPDLYDWLNGRGEYASMGENYGFKVVNHYLRTYELCEEFNPAGACQEAPVTSSTKDAVQASLGGVEQEILEAIAEGRPGFANGWVSSVAVERLLDGMRMARSIPHNKRRELLQSLGYDWHPALRDGRVNNPIPMDENKKPRLFIKVGHVNANIVSPADVAKTYQDDQGAGVTSTGQAAEVFNAVHNS